jgi:hypothetical protein
MSDRGPPANLEPGTTPQKRRRAAARFGNTERGWDSNPRSRAHEAREDSRSSTAQIWLAGVEPAISGARSRWGGQLPYSQMKRSVGRQVLDSRVASELNTMTASKKALLRRADTDHNRSHTP